MMTLDAFRKTGHNVRFDNANDINDIGGGCEFGREYDGKTFIGLMNDGRWLLIICNEQYDSTDLSVLEKRLYEDWYVHEHENDRDRIYRKTMKALQEAEEIGSPVGEQYMELMINVAAECCNRMRNYFGTEHYHDDLKNK